MSSGHASDDTERRVTVTVGREAVIDTTRIEEYVRANFDDGDEVQILDEETGETCFDNIGCQSLFPGADDE